MRSVCETVEVKPFLVQLPNGDYDEDYRDVHCAAEAIGTTEDGVRVCGECAAIFRQGGFRVDEDEL